MILVTGGLGFIGNELVRQLINDGKEVCILDNQNRIAPDIDDIISMARIINIDVQDFEKVDQIISELKPTTIYHLAAIHFIPECNENHERTIRINVEGTSSVLRASKKNGVSRFIFASSGAVYSDNIERPLLETDRVSPIDIYGYSKLFGERLCHFHSASNFKVVACRLFNNYGPRETNPHIIPEIVDQLSKGNELYLGNIEPIRDYVHTSDTSRAFKMLTDCDLPEDYTEVNICSGVGYSVNELIKTIEKITQRQFGVHRDPTRYREVDKMIQLGSYSRLNELTGWQPEFDINKGLSGLVEQLSNFKTK